MEVKVEPGEKVQKKRKTRNDESRGEREKKESSKKRQRRRSEKTSDESVRIAFKSSDLSLIEEIFLDRREFAHEEHRVR